MASPKYPRKLYVKQEMADGAPYFVPSEDFEDLAHTEESVKVGVYILDHIGILTNKSRME